MDGLSAQADLIRDFSPAWGKTPGDFPHRIQLSMHRQNYIVLILYIYNALMILACPLLMENQAHGRSGQVIACDCHVVATGYGTARERISPVTTCPLREHVDVLYAATGLREKLDLFCGLRIFLRTIGPAPELKRTMI